MLVLAGIGLRFKDIPIETIKEIKRADYVFLDFYTSVYPDINRIKRLRKDIKIVDRKFVEEELEKVLIKEKNKRIVLLVIGDPLFATTHFSLIEFCIKNKIKYKIIHAPSIFNYISRTGLFLYKFGEVVSIPFHESEYPYEVLKNNKEKGYHTLFLLDLDPVSNNYLSPSDALKKLLDLERKRKENIISLEDKIIILERMGWKDECIYYGEISKIISREWKKYPYSIIFPGKINKIEEEFLKLVSKNV